ncbi:MAG: YfcE family phosphodiesterase [Candidatus Omnitrophota bacterium]|nr:MAG: YfcE family phosphodiesterase [Candidatus Omnitrophota bacterium]
MLIGVLSDTHDNISKIRKAVKVFNERGVRHVLHAGDHIAPFVLKFFDGLKAEMTGVFGNLDVERELLKENYSRYGWHIHRDAVEVDLDGRIVVIHGTNEILVKALVKCHKYDVVVRGHTHRLQIERIGETILLNPGEVCGYLSGKSTVAILEMPEKKVEIVEL